MQNPITNRSKFETQIRSALVVLGILVALANLHWVGRTAASLLVRKVWNNRSLDALSRGADAAYGQGYMEYVRFLRGVIPADALVVNTRTTGLAQYDSLSFVQYFLFPRQVVNCPGGEVRDCLQTMATQRVYFLAGDELTVPADLLTDYEVIAFDQERLLIRPIGEPVVSD
jgi:hypothetical protein